MPPIPSGYAGRAGANRLLGAFLLGERSDMSERLRVLVEFLSRPVHAHGGTEPDPDIVTAYNLAVEAALQTAAKKRYGAAENIQIKIDRKSGEIEARIITYGGIVQSLKVPDKNGKSADVVLGFDSLDGYTSGPKPNPAFFGAIIGRYANRIGGGQFTLEGKTYHTPQNDGKNTLHSGPKGFDKAVWKAKQIPHGVELTHVSPGGDAGFPGTLTAVVRYTLLGKELKIDYSATTDKDTVLNLTNHSYFNLAGEGNGDILQNQVKINASRYTPVDDNLIPTGELATVTGTPFDFRKPTAVGSRIDNDNEQLKKGHGYDHNWVLDSSGKFSEAAEVYEPSSGRVLQVLTDQPGVQFYTGNFLDGTVKGKDGKAYPHRNFARHADG